MVMFSLGEVVFLRLVIIFKAINVGVCLPSCEHAYVKLVPPHIYCTCARKMIVFDDGCYYIVVNYNFGVRCNLIHD